AISSFLATVSERAEIRQVDWKRPEKLDSGHKPRITTILAKFLRLGLRIINFRVNYVRFKTSLTKKNCTRGNFIICRDGVR
ncbi:Hypothetical predicted protein, partial [Olea europaea subsp. europaea]